MEEKVTDSMNDELLKEFTEEEIGYAVKQMAQLKALGVDGFSAIFF